MLYLVSQIIVCLILATLLGVLIGWWLRSLRAKHDLHELTVQWEMRQTEQTQALQAELDTSTQKRLASETNASKLLTRTSTLETALSDKTHALHQSRERIRALESQLTEQQALDAETRGASEPPALPTSSASASEEPSEAVQKKLRELKGQLAAQEATISALHARLETQNHNARSAQQAEIEEFQHGPSLDPRTLAESDNEAAAARAYLAKADFSAQAAAEAGEASEDEPDASPKRAPRVIGRKELPVELPPELHDRAHRANASAQSEPSTNTSGAHTSGTNTDADHSSSSLGEALKDGVSQAAEGARDLASDAVDAGKRGVESLKDAVSPDKPDEQPYNRPYQAPYQSATAEDEHPEPPPLSARDANEDTGPDTLQDSDIRADERTDHSGAKDSRSVWRKLFDS